MIYYHRTPRPGYLLARFVSVGVPTALASSAWGFWPGTVVFCMSMVFFPTYYHTSQNIAAHYQKRSPNGKSKSPSPKKSA